MPQLAIVIGLLAVAAAVAFAALPFVALVLLSINTFVRKQGHLITAALWAVFGVWGLVALFAGNPLYIFNLIAAPFGIHADYKNWQYLRGISFSQD